MTITLYASKIIEDIKAKSHDEVAEIADKDMRYRAEAGSEKMAQIKDCLRIAGSRLSQRCLRFLVNGYSEQSDNSAQDAWSFTFEFDFGSGRRADGKSGPLTEAMHTFMVEYSLMKFYSNVSQSELSNKHGILALEAGDLVETLLYTKLPPRV